MKGSAPWSQLEVGYSRSSRFESRPRHRLTPLRFFLHSLQANSGILLRLGHDHFLPNCAQFIVHQSVSAHRKNRLKLRKVKLSLCLIKRHVMKTYEGMDTSSILILSIRWIWAVSFTLYFRGKSPQGPLIGVWVGPRAGLDAVENRNIFCPFRGTHHNHSAHSTQSYSPICGPITYYLDTTNRSATRGP
jgi:hypothetical protein